MNSHEIFSTIAILAGFIIYYAVVIGSYVLGCLGLHVLGKRRNLACHWLVWIPVANAWAIGNLADDYDGQNGIKRNFRTLLLVLNIIILGAGFIFLIPITIFVGLIASSGVMGTLAVGAVVALYGIIIIYTLLAIVAQTMNYICLYKIYESTKPEKAVKYMLLSLLVPLAQPICLFLCRNCGYDANTGKTPDDSQQNMYTLYQPPQNPEN